LKNVKSQQRETIAAHNFADKIVPRLVAREDCMVIVLRVFTHRIACFSGRSACPTLITPTPAFLPLRTPRMSVANAAAMLPR